MPASDVGLHLSPAPFSPEFPMKFEPIVKAKKLIVISQRHFITTVKTTVYSGRSTAQPFDSQKCTSNKDPSPSPNLTARKTQKKVKTKLE